MDLEIYDALGRRKQRNEFPVASGQFVENGIAVYSTGNVSTGALAASANSGDIIAPLVLTGDGVNGMVLEFTTYGPYVSAGTGSHFNVNIWDGAIGGAGLIGSSQHYSTTGSNESGDCTVRAYVPPFTGTKTFRVAASAGAAQTITFQCGTGRPMIFTAQWAHPTKILGPSSPPAIQWFDPTFNAGWSNYAAPYGPVKYGKLPDGMVIIKGLAASAGTTGTAFTLPVGYRPAQTLLFRRDVNGSWARLDINASGDVFLNPNVAAPYLSFETTMFMAEQ